MVVVLVILSFTIFLVISYFLQKKYKSPQSESLRPSRLSLSKILNTMPSGVFLQPGFTWCKILDSGQLILGIHPLIIGLIGKPDKIDLSQEGQQVGKGELLLTIYKNGLLLRLKSPVRGEIRSVNPQFSLENSWESLGCQWLYVVEPVNLSEEVGNWFVSEKSHFWLNEKYQEIKAFLMQKLSNTDLGVTMADGGDLPVGVLAISEKEIWAEFEERFL